MSSPNSIKHVEFNDLPAEMKYHIFQYLDPNDLIITRCVCRNWHYLISLWNSFLKKITFTISNDTTLQICLDSCTNWTRIKCTHTASQSNTDEAEGPITSDDTFLAKTIAESTNYWPSLTKLSLFYLNGLESETIIGAIACCDNLQALSIDHVYFMHEIVAPTVEEIEPISENITNARRVAQNLNVLKIYGVRIRNMTFLYNSFVLNTKNLKEFCVKECQYGEVFDHHLDGELDDDQTDLFLVQTRTILSKNYLTLKTLEFSLNRPIAMFKFYRRVFSTLSTSFNKRLQLEKLSLFLYSSGLSLLNDTYFWIEWNDEGFDEPDEVFIPPTELFTMWREFIGTQVNLQSLSLPHIQLCFGPFEATHNQAFLDLLTSLPDTLKELNASLEHPGINRQNLTAVYQNLTLQTTLFNLWEYNQLLADGDPAFLALENTEGRLIPKSPNLHTLNAYFCSGINISEQVMVRVFNVTVRGCPIHLKKLIIRGTIYIGDDGLQMIIEYLPLLEVLDMKSRKHCLSDYGVTGISKNWLTNTMKNLKDFQTLPVLQESDEIFVGAPLSKLEHLRTLKLPSLQKLSDIGILYGLKLPRLKKLCLSAEKPYNKITDWGLQQLAANCPALERIRLCVGCLTTVEGIHSFANNLKRIKPSKSVLKRVVRFEYSPRMTISAPD